MKTIISPLIGRCPISARDKHVKLFQVKQVLIKHRDKLIDNLVSDIPYFLARKYQAFATPNEIEIIKGKLIILKKKDVDINRFESLTTEIKRRSSVTLSNEVFLQEIDQLLIG